MALYLKNGTLLCPMSQCQTSIHHKSIMTITYIIMYTYNMIRTQIYLPQQQHDHLKALALKKRTSMSSVVRQLIDEKIGPNVQAGNINEKIGPGQWLLNQAKQAEKMGFQGPSDLASKVDEYLYG
jgi:hypothetical protein